MQVIILPITDRQNEYAVEIRDALLAAGLRVELDDRNEKLQAKIRDSQLQKIPYSLVVGGKEAEARTVAVRRHGKGDLGPRPLSQLVEDLKTEVRDRYVPEQKI